MKFYSTKNTNHLVSLREAVLQGLPPDNGLYMPTEIPVLPVDMIDAVKGMQLPEIAVKVLSPFLREELSNSSIADIAESAFNFDAPLVHLDENLYTLELFHGPTLAFKDFAARFMARLLGNFIEECQQKLTILVATSGDTGSAVAQGFYKVAGIDVVVLYPSGKVSPLQEKQMTTLGGNISVLEVNGSFDDCQALVKRAFLDAELRKSRALSSANSINIARLLPQTIYYFRALAQLPVGQPVIVSVPSGNFGNLTAGVLARKMGLPINGFIAATNANDIVPNYIHSGTFQPKPSLATLSNAMDVGNPSNFPRLLKLCNESYDALKQLIDGAAFSDKATLDGIRKLYVDYQYVADPHGAIGFLGLESNEQNRDTFCHVFLETAHPAKFPDVVFKALNKEPDVPMQFTDLMNKKGSAVQIEATYEILRDWLLKDSG